jgi:hypothetical protein
LSSVRDGGYWSKVYKEVEWIKTLAQRVKDIASKAEKAEMRDIHIKMAERERRERCVK